MARFIPCPSSSPQLRQNETCMKITFAPDLPIQNYTQDCLHFRDFAFTLQNAITYTRAPFVFGVLGDWGCGKTSILNMLYDLIDRDQRSGNQPIVPIFFEAWKYENEANLIYPLLKAIKHDYEKNGRVPLEMRGFLEKFKQVALSSTLALTDVGLRAATKALIGEGVPLKDIAEQYDRLREHAGSYESVLSGWTDQVEGLEMAFQNLLGAYAEELTLAQRRKFVKEQYRFIILIDDLDRCLPQTTIEILENIKNFLLVENCIFVLALNPSVIYQGIKIKYGGLQVDGRQYLEKILNYSFYVPDPDPEQVQAFAEKELNALVDLADRAELARYFADFSSVIRECQFTNPRKVKRILNHFLYFLQLHEKEREQFHMPDIIRFIVMAEYFPELFQLFLENADKAQSKFSPLGTGKFDITEFENQFGISLSSSFAQLRRMFQLFNLSGRPNLTQEARLVYQIVHHPVS
jgi:hypothetical protein